MTGQQTSNRVALITGAAGGLGSALVNEFATQGWRVAAAVHKPGSLSETEFVRPFVLDVTNAAQATSVVESTMSCWGRLDVLVNNAGIVRDGLVVSLPDEDWDEVLEVNLKGPFLCTQAALWPMVRQRDGHIINIASFSGRAGRAGQSNYAASKAGLLGLTQSLAKEMGGRNVRVNAVLPGFLRTRLVANLNENDLAAHAASNALRRLNDLDEVARFVVFLAATRNISGQIFQLDSRIAPSIG